MPYSAKYAGFFRRRILRTVVSGKIIQTAESEFPRLLAIQSTTSPTEPTVCWQLMALKKDTSAWITLPSKKTRTGKNTFRGDWQKLISRMEADGRICSTLTSETNTTLQNRSIRSIVSLYFLQSFIDRFRDLRSWLWRIYSRNGVQAVRRVFVHDNVDSRPRSRICQHC